MLQFANYPDQQQTASSSCWSEKYEWTREEQLVASKKRPRAVGVEELEQAVPSPQDSDALDKIYVWEDRPSILRFIDENRVRGLLLDAHDALDNAFGKDAIKSLSLVRDDEGFDTLVCLVRTPSDLEIATRALQEFDERWWLARSVEARGKVNFDFDLV
jgi:hypothetical protein